jgi:glycolate oxidase iron-sulfur subunit
MEVRLAEFVKGTAAGTQAEAIIRSCVHCGFCLATCPTYQVLSDELDSPRGRIYLIKQALEGDPVSDTTRLHLDRCLTCRSCETTCPSGVQYGKLVEIGREIVEERAPRGRVAKLQRWLLRKVLLSPALFKLLLRLGQWVRPLLPSALRRRIPARASAAAWPRSAHPRRMLLLEGCVQPALAPTINVAAAKVLDRLGITLEPVAKVRCCGALSQHNGAPAEAMELARRNIDAWWPHIEAGAEAIVATATGCGTQLIDYGDLLANDPTYAVKAKRVSELTRDIGQVVSAEADGLERLLAGRAAQRTRIAFQSPCSLQHGLKQRNVVESLMTRAGFELVPVADGHLCCGSAGTYSILQPAIAHELRDRKLKCLEAAAPDLILTANIGCLTHLAGGTDRPVRHWIEVLAPD